MIALTRLGHDAAFFLNPDLIERIDAHVDTVIRLTNGIEYVVNESPETIIDRIVDYRRRSFGATPLVTRSVPETSDRATDRATHPSEQRPPSAGGGTDATVVELPSNREVPR